MEVILEHSDYGFANQLMCPKCGCDNLHQRAVDTYFRHEDATVGIHAHVGFSGVTTDMDVKGNPSARRSGLFITFECEQCEGDKMLNIYQHKGTTFLGWSYD